MRIPRVFSFALAGALLLVMGCDMATVQDAEPLVAASESKLRHWDLLDRTDETGKSTLLKAFSGTDADSVGFVVSYTEGTSADDAEAQLELTFGTLAVRSRKYYRDGFEGASAVVSAQQLARVLEALSRLDFIEFIEPDAPIEFIFEPHIFDLNGQQSRAEFIGDTKADKGPTKAGNGTGSVDLDVFVMDTAIEAHADLNLASHLTFHNGGASDALHGTHIAGIIAAKDNGFGVVGMAPGARIHSLEVVRPEGFALMSDMISALEHVLQAKQANPNTPVVLNISMGTFVGSAEYNALDEMVEEVIDAGVTVVVSAGNDYVDAALYSPAHVDGAITVGAMLSNGVFAPFSNFGSQVDIMALGEDVLSTADNGLYATMWGTSQATAIASGAAATYLWRNPGASPADVQAALLSHSKKQVKTRGLPSGTPRSSVYVMQM